MNLVYIFLGILLLTYGGNYLVKGSVAIARRFSISPLFIGMTIVAFGTSAPELLVSVEAALRNSSDISMGNVIGSNIVNIGLILGLSSFVMPIAVKKASVKRDAPMLVFFSLLLVLFSYTGNVISRTEGIILFALLVFFICMSLKLSKNEFVEDGNNEKDMKVWVSLFMIVISCLALSLGADFLINGATGIARKFNISEKIIGLTVVAIGTSLPELAASVAAICKKEMDISIGNIIGSNIFNILCVLGITSIINPIELDFGYYKWDFLSMVLITLVLIFFIMPWKKNIGNFVRTGKTSSFMNFTGGVLGRGSGIILMALSILYIIFLFK